MTNLNKELSMDELNFVTGGGPGDHNGTGDGPGTGPRGMVRAAIAAVESGIKYLINFIPH